MNYRHAFHAGNHTEVFKHAALTLVLEHLLQKPKPFMVLDSHAGIGLYDLQSGEALRTNEHLEGVAKIFGKPFPAAPHYVEALKGLNGEELRYYPGSPEIIRGMLRDGDRLIVCELHPADGVELKRRYRADPRIAIHHRDGYEAIGGLLPPPERRGLVFIDPPFEKKDETRRIASALRAGQRKFATGIYMIWYPIKTSEIGDQICQAAKMAGFANALRVEFCPYPRDGLSLAGSGLVICNPPWMLEERLNRLCAGLAQSLGGREASWSVEPLSAGEMERAERRDP